MFHLFFLGNGQPPHPENAAVPEKEVPTGQQRVANLNKKKGGRIHTLRPLPNVSLLR